MSFSYFAEARDNCHQRRYDRKNPTNVRKCKEELDVKLELPTISPTKEAEKGK